MPLRTAILLSALLIASTAAAAPVKREAWAVKGLQRPAELVVDRWGVPHIFAASEHDAYFLQGYNAARDRLWQIDLWRKRGLGRLSASLGPDYVAQDRAARLFLYRGDMDREWAAYAPGAKVMTEAFTAGVNAYVAEVRAGAKPLPVEFKFTASQPEPWRAEDVVRIRSHALVSNVASEVARAQTGCAAGLGADRLRKKLEPPHTTVIPAGLDPCDIHADVLADYILATQPVAFSAGPAVVAALDPAAFADAAAQEGSNNWVVAPSRSATGRPILANDPHRQLGAPSLRYVAHLEAPGLSIIGAGEPALPGISFGHNATAAFGLTIFGVDQEDLYVYALDPAHPGQYRYGGGWEPMTVVREAIAVKGQAPREVELHFTRHGPVLQEDAARGRAFALRTVWMQPGASGYFQASWLTHARSWSDFIKAHDHWGAPPLNLVYADTKGDIGWAASALTPVRPNWDGLLPVPGDGRYEWKGSQGDALPTSLTPAKGWFATANEMNLPAGYPAQARRVSFEWGDRSRIERIDQVLGGDPKVTLAASMALQTDSHTAISRRLLALLAPLRSSDPQVQRALTLLKGWDGDEGVESAPAAIYEVWNVKHLGPATVARVTPAAARALIATPSQDAVISYLEHPDEALGPAPAQARDALLLDSLQAALGELSQRLGPDMATWRWGRLHHATFEPAIAVKADADARARMTLGPLELPGGASSPRAAAYRPADFSVTHGASVRMVMDVGAWDNSVVINTPGQSGDPNSRHYGDLFPLWAAGKYVPLLYSRAAVQRAAETVIVLRPAR